MAQPRIPVEPSPIRPPRKHVDLYLQRNTQTVDPRTYLYPRGHRTVPPFHRTSGLIVFFCNGFFSFQFLLLLLLYFKFDRTFNFLEINGVFVSNTCKNIRFPSRHKTHGIPLAPVFGSRLWIDGPNTVRSPYNAPLVNN